MKTLKKIGTVVLDVLIISIFVVSVILVIANITSDKENGGQPNVFGYVINSVQSNSMSGTFEKGAIVIGKLLTEDTVIETGDIISFREKGANGTPFINTHRVVDIDTSGSTTKYQTRGDNPKITEPDPELKTIDDITAVYVFHVPVVGSVIDFLKKPIGFIICLVLPMLAFIAYEVYKLISIYLQAKKAEMLEEAKEAVSDEAKDAIIREYLAKMQAENASEKQTENKQNENNAE